MRHLIALDAQNVLRRLRARAEEMVSLFSRLRDRTPMIETARTWFLTITFSELSLLEPAEQKAVNAFYDALDELRWYLQYTEDMPGQVQTRLSQLLRALEEQHRALTLAIGHPDAEGARVVDAEVVRKKAAR
ncbi:MAG: hypothetical protein IRZ16_00405 [Myxococcaceae bacterium]|nr:hypothetical protein [Myxococcaceae bacterium]